MRFLISVSPSRTQKTATDAHSATTGNYAENRIECEYFAEPLECPTNSDGQSKGSAIPDKKKIPDLSEDGNISFTKKLLKTKTSVS